MTPSFLNPQNIAAMRETAHTITCWDFNNALGETLTEKFKSAYIKIMEVTNVLIAKGAKGYFWVVMTPEVSSMFTTLKLEYTPDQVEMGMEGVTEVGILDRRWRMYVENSLYERQTILVGCGLDDTPDPEHVGRISIHNYIIHNYII
jgi:hypothetical protein